ncbi:MAG TPA: hypothetical protein VI932_00130 [Bacteroidota bacterium]|nr:hypothetical protein [Bacteroidota bacterium]
MKLVQAGMSVIIVLFIAGCGSKEEGPRASAGGVSWAVPARWKNAGERPMRIATYTVPSGGDGADGECAVFFFGSGQGGDVRSNIDRWVGQFENPSRPVESEKEVNGMQVMTVTTTGTFLSPSGPMMESQGKKENYMLMGAIVEAPGGSVFFKLTGPSATVGAAKAEFEEILESLK